MEANKTNGLLLKNEYYISNYCYPKRSPFFGNYISGTKTYNNPNIHREKTGDKNYLNRIQDISEVFYLNKGLLTPAIFGGLGTFMVSFLLRRRRPSEKFEQRVDAKVSGQYLETFPRGFYKLEFFLNIFSIIAISSCTAYIYEVIKGGGGTRRFAAVVPTVLIIIFLFASEEFLLYTVCPGCFEGVMGISAVGDFLNFVALSIGAISVGESYGITAKTTGTKVLLAQESLFYLLVLALLVSFLIY